MDVMPAHDLFFGRNSGVNAATLRGKHILPARVTAGGRIFFGDGIGQPDITKPEGQVLSMKLQCTLDLLRERWFASDRQGNHSVLFSLSVPDHDLAAFEIDVFNSQPTRFKQPHSGPVVEFRQQPDPTSFGTLVENESHLVDREDSWQPIRLFGSGRVDVADVDLQNVLVKKQDCRERLVLCAGGNSTVDRQVGQKFGKFRPPHFEGMAPASIGFSMKAKEPRDPIRVCRFGSNGIVEKSHFVANAVQKSWFGSRRRFLYFALHFPAQQF